METKDDTESADMLALSQNNYSLKRCEVCTRQVDRKTKQVQPLSETYM